MMILAIDLSTTTGAVAVVSDGTCVLREEFKSERSHSALLFPVLERTRLASPKLDRIVIGLGPGSYAGTRIAIAAALGMQLTLGCELVGIPSFAALHCEHREYLAVGDARRSTFYYSRIVDGLCVDGPSLVEEDRFREILSANSLPVLASEIVPGFPDIQLALPSAERLARLAEKDLGVIARGDLEPIYLREPHITQPKPRPA